MGPWSTRPRPPLALVITTVTATAGSLVLLQWLASGYLVAERGFPLDDSWIHAVYGRELARSGTLAYNPGIPATGATSLLWAALLAIPHLLLTRTPVIVLAVKLLGLALLAGAAAVAGWAAGAPRRGAACLAAALLLLYPPLLAGAVSGMEVGLAALAAATLIALLRAGPTYVYGLACAIAPLARPELAVLGMALPALLTIRRRERRRAWGCWGWAALGIALCVGMVAWRNVAASGRPLPATFYAKVSLPPAALAGRLLRGFSYLLGDLPLTDWPLLILGSGLAVVALLAQSVDAPRNAGGTWLAGLALGGLSFALVDPVDPVAFYHQRYALPGVALLLAAMPPLASWAFDHVTARLRIVTMLAVGAAVIIALGLDAPIRLHHLENDAHNIDDVQVAVGKHLAAAPTSAHVWAIDAGAIRYFGAAFVVDMIGLNTPEILGPDASSFLRTHPPSYLEVVPGWSRLELGPGSEFGRTVFRPSTDYTVTSFPPMQVHVLVRCRPPGEGVFQVPSGSYSFTCSL